MIHDLPFFLSHERSKAAIPNYVWRVPIYLDSGCSFMPDWFYPRWIATFVHAHKSGTCVLHMFVLMPARKQVHWRDYFATVIWKAFTWGKSNSALRCKWTYYLTTHFEMSKNSENKFRMYIQAFYVGTHFSGKKNIFRVPCKKEKIWCTNMCICGTFFVFLHRPHKMYFSSKNLCADI